MGQTFNRSHYLLDKLSLGNSQWQIIIELLPDTPTEAVAIQRVEQVQAAEKERELIKNYLHFDLGLGAYSVISVLQQQGHRIALQIAN